eukprot:2320362-Rhodomonas_salina.1
MRSILGGVLLECARAVPCSFLVAICAVFSTRHGVGRGSPYRTSVLHIAWPRHLPYACVEVPPNALQPYAISVPGTA